MSNESLAGRVYMRLYRVRDRQDLVARLTDAIERSGWTVLYRSQPTSAPFFFTATHPGGEVVGILCYLFRCNTAPILGRSSDEHRLQVRYGGEASWGGSHPVGQDPARADVTVVLGVHERAGIFIGLDPQLYDSLPMGISIEFKDADVGATQRTSWHVWERTTVAGSRRERRTTGLETLVAFTPERFLDYVRFERHATQLDLDPPLRFTAAHSRQAVTRDTESIHALEVEYALSASDILEIIQERKRLGVAVRGGVAERHLERYLRRLPNVRGVDPDLTDGPPDYLVTLRSRAMLRVECKNASPVAYRDGRAKVEVQKTRASKGDPKGRLYRPDQFDVLAACLYPRSGRWDDFRFRAASELERDRTYPDRVAPMQPIDDSWSPTLPETQ